jgi:5-formyltetrahydrofolate cyclo-ligase
MDPELKAWRKATRETLIAARMAVSAEDRAQAAEVVAARIEPLVKAGRTLSFYWPMKGELDLRPLAARLHAAGVRLALPVVVEKRQPMVFRPWFPGCAMMRGIWNIPQPATEETVVPDVTLAPVVGFTEDCYRLGYGGGYFDRTLAVISPRPLAIGLGLELQRLETICPQPHDVRLDAVITEQTTRENIRTG